MNELSVTLEFGNLEEFKKLIGKAESDAEILKEDLVQINNYTLKVSET